MNLRDNWRIVLLVLFLVVSLFALFVPGGVVSDGEDADGDAEAAFEAGISNLRFGLELSGGTRIRAPLVGLTASEVNVTTDNKVDIERTVADELDVSVTDVTARQQTRTVEVFVENITEDEFAAALQQAGVSITTDRIEQGVTDRTRDAAVDVIRSKVTEAGFSGGRVQQVTTSTGDHFIVIEMPNANRTQVENLVDERGVVEVVAQFPDENGSDYHNETVLERDDFASIGTATQGQRTGPHVPITLTGESGQQFQSRMVEYGFTGEGVSSCHGVPEGQKHCLHTVVDGEVVYSADMGSRLASSMQDGTFAENPTFIMRTTNMSEARSLMIHLRAGALPAPLDLDDRGTSYFLSPSQAEEFKLYSLITGLIAALTVAGTVFFRYGDSRVAAPMFLTAISEVLILLGFAAAVALPLDLSHIAGFIAVIGTGVDDLIIIADEVMAEGSVNSDRVFRSRFRKAFWVIGAAAATTIIAMSPLAVLSLGDLQGFAIITILGVLVGVLVTRPAYGDVLRALMTDK
jgi:preprotein translocase subunit SecD